MNKTAILIWVVSVPLSAFARAGELVVTPKIATQGEPVLVMVKDFRAATPARRLPPLTTVRCGSPASLSCTAKQLPSC